MARERILITVKTYPTLSATYGELVCTAGLREDGSWIRIYPIPFRRLEEFQKFEKYRIVEADIARNWKDSRPESHRVDFQSLHLTDEILPTEDAWRERRQWVLYRGTVHEDLTELIEAANQRNDLSLATFKPAKVTNFKIEPQAPEWDQTKLDKLQAAANQTEMFPEWEPKNLTRIVRKLPWKFSYELIDAVGRKSTMMIEDWEIGALYWNCLRGSTAEDAIVKVRQMYFENFSQKDLHFFLGTTREWHGRGKNPFVVIGTFHPPHRPQMDLF